MTTAPYSQAGASAPFSAATSVSVSNPTTVVDGELAIMHVAISDANTTITWPSGWTEIGQVTEGSSFTAGLAWKRLAASDGGGSQTVNFGASSTGAARIRTYTSAKLDGTPFESLVAAQGTGTSMTTGAITTSGPDRKLVAIYLQDSTGTSTTPSGWTNNLAGASNGTRQYTDSKDIASATVDPGATRTFTSAAWACWAWAILPKESRPSIVT